MSILMFDLLLGGDNAVVIALASRNLPRAQQKKAILLGTLGAIILRVALTIIIVLLLKIPFVMAAGGIMLVYIALKLIKNDDSGEACKSAASLPEAIKIIILADLIMSLDNMLAVAAVCKGHWGLIIIGLSISIPIIIFSSQVILYLIRKFPVIIYAGAGLLAWTAGKMIIEDVKIAAFLHHNLGSLVGIIEILVPLVITLAVVGYGLAANARKRKYQNFSGQ